MADPVGEDGWLSLVDEASRTASDLEQRIGVVELYKRSIAAEPWSLKLWLAYCEWVWSLYTDCQTADAGWPEDEQALGQELFSLDTALDVWQQGAQATQYRLNDSGELWNRYISIELEQLAKSPTREYIERVRKLFLERLQIPQAGWDETSQIFSSFITKYDEPSWEATMVQAAKLAEAAKNLYANRERHETELERARSSGNIEDEKAIMVDYLDFENKQARMKPKKGASASPLVLVVALYERALASTLGSDPTIWQDYIVFLGLHAQAQPHMPTVLSVIARAIQHCPWSGTLWARYIVTAESENLSYSDIESIKHAATNTRDLDRDGMSNVVEVYVAWCGYLTRRASLPGASDEDIDVAEMGLHTALESVEDWARRLDGKKEYEGDPAFSIERIMIQYLTQKGSILEARGYWQRLVKAHASSYDFWQQYYAWEMTVHSTNSPPSLATSVLNQAIHQHALDWPEKIMDIYVRHCMIYGDSKSLITAIDTVHYINKGVAKRREREAAEAAALYAQQQPQQAAAAESTGQSPGTSKRKREVAPDEVDDVASKKAKKVDQEIDQETAHEQHLKRDRENTSILVTNLPNPVTQTKVRQYFKDYGHVNSLTVMVEPDEQSSTALIEFRSNEDVQSALIRDGKYFGEKQIKVQAATGLTLYVTNYPPAADESYIRGLFKNCGEIFSIRWPSLKYNTHRRFCYITFRNQDAAAAATRMNGQILPGGFKLSALYSDPSRKKSREGALAEERELHVTGLDHSLNEEDLKPVFAKYGSVEAVRLLKSKGAAFIDFKTKDDARAALALDKTKLKSGIMAVELSTGKNFKPTATSKGTSASPAPDADNDPAASPSAASEPHINNNVQHGPSRAEINERTIALMNIPDTVNDARVRTIAEPFGSVVKLVLRPDHQGAIIEYSDAMSAGRAALGLENHEIAPGRRLRTGSAKDLYREKDEIKTDRIQVGQAKKPPADYIQPTAPIRRPGAAGRGGLGKKRGLGYAAAKPAGPSGSSAGVSGTNGNTNAAENVAPKSNADFKAMFLSGEK
jgi:RNA recognition motif-containing protein